MNEEMKDTLLFSLFAAEANKISTSGKISHIMDHIRTKYGGYWTVHYLGNRNGYVYINSAYGRQAIFDYDKQRWTVFGHNCSSAYQIYARLLLENPIITEYMENSIEFNNWTALNETMKTDLLHALFIAENGNIIGQKKVNLIGKRMESVYGGSWSVFAPNGKSNWGFKEPFRGQFNYEGHWWIIYKNLCG